MPREHETRSVHYKETQFGFEYGSAAIERFHHDGKTKSVTVGIKTSNDTLRIRITRTGLIRVFSETHGELHPGDTTMKTSAKLGE